jgi:hypothetical protein
MVDLVQKYARHRHPTIEEMMEAQGVAFSGDPACFPGDFRPEEESVDDFLAALDEWRGHIRTDPAA